MSEADGAPLRWRAARIERKVAQTPRVTGVFLRTTLGAHDAGQHVDVRLTAADGYQARRSYSIASAPGAALLELCVERLDDGEVSPWFHDVAQPGDAIEVRGPIGGHFVWRPGDGGPLLLLGGGSGVVPLMAMLRHRAAAAPEVSALLVQSTRTFGDVLFRDELVNAADAQPGLRVVFATTRGKAARPGDYERRVDAAVLAEILERWGHEPRHVYVCGANRFVEAMTRALVDLAIPAERIRTERYGGD